jgi:polar amino acid transport system substrate-binding protein
MRFVLFIVLSALAPRGWGRATLPAGPGPQRPAGFGLLKALVALAASLCSPAAPAQQQVAPAPFVMATHQPDTNFQGQWVRRIYTEAFRRLGVPMEVQAIPLQRMTEMLDRGELDGDVGRVHAHGLSHPELVRVEESMYDVVFGLYTIDQTIELKRIEELDARPWRAAYVRGVAVCERLLKPHIAPENLSSLVNDEQGMHMLAMGRVHFYCAANHSVADAASREHFRGLPPPRLVLSMGTIALYPYLHRRHAALAPRLAEVLREMRSQGLIERFRTEALAASRK